MVPVIKAVEKKPETFQVVVCVTAQHRGMLDQVLKFFKIIPDYDLNLMQPDQTLFDITAKGIMGLQDILNKCKPDIVCVQGDTTTAFVGALASFYINTKIAHIEAGLRSGVKYAPYPEEMNRTLVGHLADYHFAPTERAKQNLLCEGITQNIYIVGNTVIDALFLGLSIIEQQGDEPYRDYFSFLDRSKTIILVTGHRRENFGKPFENICYAIKEIAMTHPKVQVVYPVHLNPNVMQPVNSLLGNLPNIHLIAPLDYPHFIWLLNQSFLVLTDSGGIQEEAPSLGKPVLVMRDVTERIEGLEAGTAKLVGTDRKKIIQKATALLADKESYKIMSQAHNPYGDGEASKRIADLLQIMGEEYRL